MVHVIYTDIIILLSVDPCAAMIATYMLTINATHSWSCSYSMLYTDDRVPRLVCAMLLVPGDSCNIMYILYMLNIMPV